MNIAAIKIETLHHKQSIFNNKIVIYIILGGVSTDVKELRKKQGLGLPAFDKKKAHTTSD